MVQNEQHWFAFHQVRHINIRVPRLHSMECESSLTTFCDVFLNRNFKDINCSIDNCRNVRGLRKGPIWTIFCGKLLKLGWVAFHSLTFQLKCLDFQSNRYKKLVPYLSCFCNWLFNTNCCHGYCAFFFQPSLFEDMVYVSKAFDELVESYPETINCQSQNKPITEVFSPKSDAWDTPREIQPEDSVVTLASGYKSKLWNWRCFSLIKIIFLKAAKFICTCSINLLPSCLLLLVANRHCGLIS